LVTVRFTVVGAVVADKELVVAAVRWTRRTGLTVRRRTVCVVLRVVRVGVVVVDTRVECFTRCRTVRFGAASAAVLSESKATSTIVSIFRVFVIVLVLRVFSEPLPQFEQFRVVEPVSVSS
jgi:hypothetical protein